MPVNFARIGWVYRQAIHLARHPCECPFCQWWTETYWDPGVTRVWMHLQTTFAFEPPERSIDWCPPARALRHEWVRAEHELRDSRAEK